MSEVKQYWVVIPAAGVGKRMLVNHPKQYLQLAGSPVKREVETVTKKGLTEKNLVQETVIPAITQTVIEHTLSRFSHHKKIKGIVVVISKGDEYWPKLTIDSQVPLYVTEGGQERCHSVFNGLSFLHSKAKANDWVLVHDAARPCLHLDDIENLMEVLENHPVGGLLGLPVADTLKYCDQSRQVQKTVDRTGLWRALTPQMFRYQPLVSALEVAVKHPEQITDEASAMELAGHEPLIVEGRWDNIKITHPQDLSQAQLILNSHSIKQ